MPMNEDPRYDSALRVADLFRRRNADRLGLSVSDADHARDAELDAFGQTMGLAPRMGGAQQAATPGTPAPSAVATVPAGDAPSPMAPPLAAPVPPAAAPEPPKRSGVPALDALAKPGKRSRGLYHNRKLGRVLGGGTM